MVSNRCKIAVREVLRKMGLHFVVVDLGEVEIMEEVTGESLEHLKAALLDEGFELMDDRKAILIEKIKNVITDMIHNSDEEININYSDFIVGKLDYDYNYLSTLFSELKGITIQQFIIVHKIERVKELLRYGELNLTEISYKLHYSSVGHLSNQFKKVTGLSPSEFKQLKHHGRRPLEEVGNPDDAVKSNNAKS